MTKENRLTEVLVRLHIISILKVMDDGLLAMEWTHMPHDTGIGVGLRERAFTHSQRFEAKTLLICRKVR